VGYSENIDNNSWNMSTKYAWGVGSLSTYMYIGKKLDFGCVLLNTLNRLERHLI
jgi:hypothetical protein